MMDLHCHTAFSADAETAPEVLIETAIAKGVQILCITDHMDLDMPNPEGMDFTFDPDAYFKTMQELQRRYANDIRLLVGVELGLQPHLAEAYDRLLAKYPWDFAIGSRHLVFGLDPYYPEAFAGREDAAVYEAYFRELLESLQAFHHFDTLGHLDYVVRYGKQKAEAYSYERFADIIDEILTFLIENRVALEVNAAGLRENGFANPHPDVLLRYRELGGTLVTFGSDAHTAELVGDHFSDAAKLLSDLGFSELTYFEGRQAKSVSLV